LSKANPDLSLDQVSYFMTKFRTFNTTSDTTKLASQTKKLEILARIAQMDY